MGELIFNKYEIQKAIGKGGFSNVWLVKDTHLNKLLAVKKYTCEIGMDIEVNTLKDLEHKGLPIIYDYRTDGEDKYLFMEYVEGMTLREYQNAHKIVPFGIALKWIGEIAQILEYLHGLNPAVIYRDLKPENIMIKNDGHIKLIDFGGVLLKSRTVGESRTICGTKGYSAPELMRGFKAEFSADIYSMGVVFYEMLTGIHLKDASMEYQGIRSVDKAIPKGIEIVIGNCLCKKPANRYQTVNEFIADLTNYRKLVLGKDIVFFIKKLVVISAYLMCFASIALPLLDGVYEDELPFPFLIKPLLMLGGAVILHYILLNRRGGKDMKVIKSILLTEKKSGSMLIGLFFVLGLVSGLMFGSAINTTAYAASNTSFDSVSGIGSGALDSSAKEMWVDLCDTSERKMLLKNDAVYKVEDKVRFEIPKDSIPEDDLKIQITATGKDGRRYISRYFNVSNKSE